MDHLPIIDTLKNKGFRITNTRKAIIEILTYSKRPLSIQDLLSKLLSKDISVNKTTAYRELDFLISQSITKEIDFGDGKKRYEISSNKHHHHLVCVECEKVIDIELKVDLVKEEQRIAQESNFKVKQHSFELFGVCKNCQTK